MRQFLFDFEAEQRDLRRAVLDIMWHMRGSLSREEAWILSLKERTDIHKLIKERMDLVQKTGLALI